MSIYKHHSLASRGTGKSLKGYGTRFLHRLCIAQISKSRDGVICSSKSSTLVKSLVIACAPRLANYNLTP